MQHVETCDALDGEIERFATVLADAHRDARIPTCPEWNVQDLTTHLGTVHRWTTVIVDTASPSRVSWSEIDLGTEPYDDAWIRSGGSALVQALRRGDPDTPLWSWGTDQHLRFWSRRQLHETLVHRCDLELALGVTPIVDSTYALDAIDEFISNLEPSKRFSPALNEVRGDGEILRFRANESGSTWDVRLEPEGFHVGPVDGDATAVLEGSADDLLLVLYRRRALAASGLRASGDRALVEYWLDHSALA